MSGRRGRGWAGTAGLVVVGVAAGVCVRFMLGVSPRPCLSQVCLPQQLPSLSAHAILTLILAC